LTAVLALTSLAAAPLVANLAAPAAAAPRTLVHWSPCERECFECATVPVPLDHDQPEGATILLSVIRLPATDPGHRIGSLLLNPGGPGGSGVDLALSIAEFYSGRGDPVPSGSRPVGWCGPLVVAGVSAGAARSR
jgi:hypothetical protein